ncbi:hypothetical protein D3C81_948370 [compost metagenome]
MLLPAELQASQLQGAVEAEWSLQLTRLGEALLEVDVRQVGEHAVQLMQLPLLQQLLTVIVAPADPGLQMPAMMADPAFELSPHFTEGGGRIDIGLADMRQLTAKRRQLRAPPWFDEALEMIDLTALPIDQRRANFDNFHIRDRPAPIVCGCFQVDHQPMPHSRLPCKTR